LNTLKNDAPEEWAFLREFQYRIFRAYGVDAVGFFLEKTLTARRPPQRSRNVFSSPIDLGEDSSPNVELESPPLFKVRVLPQGASFDPKHGIFLIFLSTKPKSRLIFPPRFQPTHKGAHLGETLSSDESPHARNAGAAYLKDLVAFVRLAVFACKYALHVPRPFSAINEGTRFLTRRWYLSSALLWMISLSNASSLPLFFTL